MTQFIISKRTDTHKKNKTDVNLSTRICWIEIRSCEANFEVEALKRSDLFITSMITDRIGRHAAVLFPINHKNYNF